MSIRVVIADDQPMVRTGLTMLLSTEPDIEVVGQAATGEEARRRGLYDALRAGASGFMLKHASPSEVADAVRRVAAGDVWLDPSIAGRILDPRGSRAAQDRLERDRTAAVALAYKCGFVIP